MYSLDDCLAKNVVKAQFGHILYGQVFKGCPVDAVLFKSNHDRFANSNDHSTIYLWHGIFMVFMLRMSCVCGVFVLSLCCVCVVFLLSFSFDLFKLCSVVSNIMCRIFMFICKGSLKLVRVEAGTVTVSFTSPHIARVFLYRACFCIERVIRNSVLETIQL